MSEYDIKYRLVEAPTITEDGSGFVIHSLQAVARLAGSADPFQIVNGYERNLYVDGNRLYDVLNLPDGTNKIQAYKSLLVESANKQPIAPSYSWTKEAIALVAAANALSISEAARADAYILSLAADYPVDFNL